MDSLLFAPIMVDLLFTAPNLDEQQQETVRQLVVSVRTEYKKNQRFLDEIVPDWYKTFEESSTSSSIPGGQCPSLHSAFPNSVVPENTIKMIGDGRSLALDIYLVTQLAQTALTSGGVVHDANEATMALLASFSRLYKDNKAMMGNEFDKKAYIDACCRRVTLQSGRPEVIQPLSDHYPLFITRVEPILEGVRNLLGFDSLVTLQYLSESLEQPQPAIAHLVDLSEGYRNEFLAMQSEPEEETDPLQRIVKIMLGDNFSSRLDNLMETTWGQVQSLKALAQRNVQDLVAVHALPEGFKTAEVNSVMLKREGDPCLILGYAIQLTSTIYGCLESERSLRSIKGSFGADMKGIGAKL